MCTDANRMVAMASRATTASPCVHVLTLPHARVDKAGCFIRTSLALRLRVQVRIFFKNYRHMPLPLLMLIAYSHV